MKLYAQITPWDMLVHPKSEVFSSKYGASQLAYNCFTKKVLRIKSYCMKVPSDYFNLFLIEFIGSVNTWSQYILA